MVTYQRWTAVAFDVAREKGADLGEEQTEVISVAADIWNDRDDLERATVSEARSIAQSEIEV